MAHNLRNRSFLKEIDFEPGELRFLLRLAEALKLAKYAGTEAKRLDGKEIALIFEKTSTRTRSAFEVAAFDQGGHVTYLDPSGSQLGHKESIADTAQVLGRMYDAIEYRGNAQADVETLAEHAGVPVYNGLTDEWHPTQMLADFLTMHEASNKPYDAVSYAFMGDCRFNMGRSLLAMGALMGSDVRHSLILRLRDTSELSRFVEAELGPLLEHDANRNLRLLPTLRAYVEFGRNKSAAAKALHLERRSLYHRLEKIETLLGRDLQDVETCTRLHVALKALAILRRGDGKDPLADAARARS
jgi:hypothetical protein